MQFLKSHYKQSRFQIATDYHQQEIDAPLQEDLRRLVRLAAQEDLERSMDLTTCALVPETLRSQAAIVARQPGVAAGVDLIEVILDELETDLTVELSIHDGDRFERGTTLAKIAGSTRDLLTAERTVLNVLGKLCGIATWTAKHVDAIHASKTLIYDTRKTTPGWRRLEKYAVRCGGGWNHRSGLYDAILIKDNHLACHRDATGQVLSPADAIALARAFENSLPKKRQDELVVEIEVDSLEQLDSALPAKPDIILLDNMSPELLAKAVRRRDELESQVILEASGGVRLDTIAAIAASGVDRVSIGGLTHSAVNLDVGLDW